MATKKKKKIAGKSALALTWIKKILVHGCAWSTLVLSFVFIYVFYSRPDWATALTVVPAWGWMFWLIIALGLCWNLAKIPARIAVVGWLLFAVLFIEEPRGVIEGWLRHGPKDTREGLVPCRIVTHNCKGEVAVLSQILELKPDFLMLQEAPMLLDVEKLAHELYGDAAQVAWNFDTCLVTGYPMRDVVTHVGGRRYFTRATVNLPGLGDTEFVTLRLSRSLPLWKVWKPSVWREQMASRERQKSQFSGVLDHLTHLNTGRPLIFAGDFNVPQGDGVVEPIEPYLVDAFSVAGRGLGNTFPNESPLVRIDQAWLSQHFTIVDVRVYKSNKSDHRILVVDTMIPDPLFQ